MKTILWGSLIVIISFVACSKDSKDDIKIEINDLALITGLNIVNHNGDILKGFGNPNDAKHTSINNDGSIGVRTNYSILPNPAVDVIYVHANGSITSLWIVPGHISTQYQNIDFDEVYKSTAIDTTGIDKKSVINNTDQVFADGQLNLNISDLEQGFYKIIVEVDNSNLFWQAIYKSDVSYDLDEMNYIPWK